MEGSEGAMLARIEDNTRRIAEALEKMDEEGIYAVLTEDNIRELLEVFVDRP